MPIDVARVRADTPGCAEVVHLNNAGAALQPRPVYDAVTRHLELEYRIGSREAERVQAERLAGTYASLARLIGAEPAEIALSDSSTGAWDQAFYAVPLGEGDRILTTTSEYESNAIAMIQVATGCGAEIVVVPDDDHGQISLDALDELLDERVKIVAINHVPTHNGLVNPAAEVGRRARAAGALFLLDATQSVGQIELDVRAMSVHMLAATGRKYLRGPRGIGFLYVAPEALDRLRPAMLNDWSASWTGPASYEIAPGARRFESFERSPASVLGLGAAAEYALELGVADIRERVARLAETLRTRLAEVPGVTVHDRGAERSGLVTFTKKGHDVAALVARLGERKINTTASVQEFRYDLTRGEPAVVRASVHYYNTEEELDVLLGFLSELR
ncbi:MAG: aminotransferase class V-fold PLP-dependent enzyme [Streptosporangiales bacterium]|nr:aminotransferase class V-fold PLP-dependent enzyme [Streptosporangiales bacterium]